MFVMFRLCKILPLSLPPPIISSFPSFTQMLHDTKETKPRPALSPGRLFFHRKDKKTLAPSAIVQTKLETSFIFLSTRYVTEFSS